jgi:hypothetical protein
MQRLGHTRKMSADLQTHWSRPIRLVEHIASVLYLLVEAIARVTVILYQGFRIEASLGLSFLLSILSRRQSLEPMGDSGTILLRNDVDC